MDSDNSRIDSDIVSDEFILQSNLTHIHLAHTNNGTASPALSSSSDSDAFNGESARLHFGPLSSPERRFVAEQVSLFPPPQITPLRRSPRLSSPRPPSINPQDAYSTEDSDDLERVEEQLVNESDDEGVSGDSGPGTPRPGTPLPDEPSSALADRITRALDNPSPPPSPSAAPRKLNPDFSTSRSEERPSSEIRSFPLNSADLNQPQPSRTQLDDLISFDSFPGTPAHGKVNTTRDLFPPEPISSSVDDLLSRSPGVSLLDIPSATLSIPPPVLVDSDKVIAEDALMRSPCNPTCEGAEGNVGTNNLMPPRDAGVHETPTPLRRSARARQSVTPQPSAAPNAECALFAPLPKLAVPSPARTRRKKRASVMLPEEIVEDSQSEEDIKMLSPTQKVGGVVAGEGRSPGKAGTSFSRELGSLSPASTNVLTQLIPSTSDGSSRTDTEFSAPRVMLSFSTLAPFQTTLAPHTPSRFMSPVRFSSPVRASSPAKFRLQAPDPNDTTNTPARRIPVEEAIAQGHLSPQKAALLGYKADAMPRAPLFSVSTPARRVLIVDSPVASTSGVRTGFCLGSPVRASSKEPKASSQHDVGRGDKQRIVVGSSRPAKVAPATNANLSAPSTQAVKLPFPLVPSVSLSKPEEAEKQVAPKSALKHLTSRIPRMGVKPYARPAEAKIRVQQATVIPTPMRTVDLSKPGTVQTMNDRVTGNDPRRPDLLKRPVSSTIHVKPVDTTSILKRKRGPESSSPTKPRTVMLRKVPQVIITKNPPASSARGGVPSKYNTTPTKSITDNNEPSGELRIRRVVDREPPSSSSESRPPADPSLFTTVAESHSSVSPEGNIQEDAMPKTIDEPAVDQDPRRSQSPEPLPAGPLPPATLSEGVRRTTRLRRTLQATSDTGIVSDGTTGATQPRRKVSRRTVSRSDDAFAGMSATALKALTTSNTVRNQVYLAAKLETEVIRREGVRPESPLVKVRTISQRQQDEKEKGRKERAARRARRSESDFIGSSDIEGQSDGHSSSVEDQYQGSPLARHRRGAGDEEDYETPDVERRHRLFLQESGEENILDLPKRRVKWDQGLYTTVFLDEVKLGTRQPSKENRSVKGCLALTAKAARLDTLGNLPNADSPLADLVQQNITVKKFVYDNDDDEPVEEVVVVKNTRSKSKKTKS